MVKSLVFKWSGKQTNKIATIFNLSAVRLDYFVCDFFLYLLNGLGLPNLAFEWSGPFEN